MDSTAAVAALLRAIVPRTQASGPGLRLPPDPPIPYVRFQVMPGPATGPVRPLTVAVQAYAYDDATASDITERMWRYLDGQETDELTSVSGLTPPAPHPDPDYPDVRRWQLTCQAVHVTY
ncbi:hypothetical protein PQI66_00350 [Corynebacterium sp. USCH3]|uniref:hypothetical protein n=1 Tax=Corynebacterium sp. USCH3 TaxID=3024840 RepID=UPI003094E905